MGAKLDFYKTALRNRAKKGFLGYPVATIAFYGPDDRRATKVALGIIFDEDDETRREMNRWFSAKGDIRRDASVFEAMFRLTQSRGVRSVAMPEEILGCPHEEDIDYAEGEWCPQCPFWAGRERPLDTLAEPTRFPSRWSLEKARADLEAEEAENESPPTSIERAQDLMWTAWDESAPHRRVAMARQALEISADCADAYVMLAIETARNNHQALELYEKGIAAGERALGAKRFEEDAGHFWGILETRPYMRARKGLAECLYEIGRYDEAISHFKEMLRLNPNDNQGNRDVLAACYLSASRNSDALELLNKHPEGITANWNYTHALVQFRLQGISKEANEALQVGVANNPHVPKYLRGLKRMPRDKPNHYGIGSIEEAIVYMELYSKCWKSTPGALDWLASQV
jgi:tetratricopeptide (TPR) repeat protein